MVARTGFREVKRRVLADLRNGAYNFEPRADADTKNLLAGNSLAAEDLCAIIETCRGDDHASSAHHVNPDWEVHVLKKSGWYVKFYFVEETLPYTMFISVHR